MRLFLYGTLLHGRELARRSGHAGRWAPRIAGALPGWRRVGSLSDARYPTLRRARSMTVHGEVVAVPARALARLSGWEGPAYRLARLVVRTPNGKTVAYAWIAAGSRRSWDAKRS